MITLKKKLQLIKACFGEYKLSASAENASVACILCLNNGKVSSKKKLSIDLKKGIYHCWVCESKGRNIGSLAVRYSREKDAAQLLKKSYGGDKEEIPTEEINNIISLPDDFKLIYDLGNSRTYKKYYNYLLRRGFTSQKMAKFRIGISEKFEFKNRVIFPSFTNEYELNYFVSRSIDPNINFNFRYKNAKTNRKEVIFRHSDLDFSKELILTEGVFDLANCPENSTCILGSWLSDDYFLFREIVKNKTPVILCLDPDAKKKSLKIADLLQSYCVPVKLSQHSDRDFGDLSEEEINYFISTSKHYDNASRIGYLINEIHSGSIY
jgi:hypothetical protein